MGLVTGDFVGFELFSRAFDHAHRKRNVASVFGVFLSVLHDPGQKIRRP
jgi:hypothetical protein